MNFFNYFNFFNYLNRRRHHEGEEKDFQASDPVYFGPKALDQAPDQPRGLNAEVSGRVELILRDIALVQRDIKKATHFTGGASRDEKELDEVSVATALEASSDIVHD